MTARRFIGIWLHYGVGLPAALLYAEVETWVWRLITRNRERGGARVEVAAFTAVMLIIGFWIGHLLSAPYAP